MRATPGGAVIITGDVARALEETLGIDFEQLQQEQTARRDAAARAAEEERRRIRAERETQVQDRLRQIFVAEIDRSIVVLVDGERVTDPGDLVCPRCGQPQGTLDRLAQDAARMVELRHAAHRGPVRSLSYPGTDKRWMASPVFSEPLRCEFCRGSFDLAIIVLP
ncbi:hypothetical protein [Methanoculleus sp.]|uniref:hypothetical protein n=1 Tax=Methanoculleus sp. TaxID=90427 RepID=UPI001BD3828B|nr:hypothetical protein [Methanoculleus sp.]